MSYPLGEIVADRYQVEEVIGQGGQGLVYRAHDRRMRKAVAIKMLPRSVSKDPAHVERMAREQQAMVKLAGTHAVGFIDLCTTNTGELCLVMELLEGLDLEDHLEGLESSGKRMRVDEILKLMAPIVDTLEKAHAVGIVHRDLKPGNIFLLSARVGGGTRLLDFGFARLNTSRPVTELGQVMGSPSYIAPEMWKGRSSEADQRVDVYSTAVILFRMFAGKLPFGGKTLAEKYVQATSAERPSLQRLRPELTERVDMWVERALAIDRDDRFPNVRAMWNELKWALGLASRPVVRGSSIADTLDVRQMRKWLETPIHALPNTLTAAWNAAASALRRLTGEAPRGEAAPRALPPPPPDTAATPRVRRLPPPPPSKRTPGLKARAKRRSSRAPPADDSILDISDVAEEAEDSINRRLRSEAPPKARRSSYRPSRRAPTTSVPKRRSTRPSARPASTGTRGGKQAKQRTKRKSAKKKASDGVARRGRSARKALTTPASKTRASKQTGGAKRKGSTQQTRSAKRTSAARSSKQTKSTKRKAATTRAAKQTSGAHRKSTTTRATKGTKGTTRKTTARAQPTSGRKKPKSKRGTKATKTGASSRHDSSPKRTTKSAVKKQRRRTKGG